MKLFYSINSGRRYVPYLEQSYPNQISYHLSNSNYPSCPEVVGFTSTSFVAHLAKCGSECATARDNGRRDRGLGDHRRAFARLSQPAVGGGGGDQTHAGLRGRGRLCRRACFPARPHCRANQERDGRTAAPGCAEPPIGGSARKTPSR